MTGPIEELRQRAGRARTYLFVPGDRPERFHKAASSGAGLVILDLEDAVAGAAKEAARHHVVTALRAGLQAAVRINAVGTPWHEDDVAALDSLASAVVVPHAEEAEHLTRLATQWPVIALVESARGILAAPSLAAVAGVERLALGSFDLAAELGVAPEDRDAMAPARGALVLASAAARISPPVDGVTGDVHDREALVSDLAHARQVGFAGKLCIHPGQVATSEQELRPSDDEVAWARRVLAASAESSGGVCVVDGRMVDRPVLLRAERILAEVP